MCVLGSLGRRINSFFRQDTGAVTVEGVLWVPIYGVFFALLVDVSLMFNGQSQARRIIQDVNRLASTGYLGDMDEPALIEQAAEDRATASLSHLSSAAEVETTIVDNVVSIVATIPGSDLQATGILSIFSDIQIVVSASHLVES
ncbi:hypothetical protein EF888_11060 [Silicimonas algicola]|nr:hypothetical protein [Silicimonas algicola]AZQ67623.1 hypothetical protein EF888_11060 [Silicimonas algicola]